MAQNPFQKFVSNSLKDFENHLRSLEMKEGTVDQRMRGAREFAKFLIGEPHYFNERTKSSI